MKYHVLLIITVAFIMTSCSSTKAVVAINKSTDQFIVLQKDKRILYEKGARENAKKIAKKLDTAIQTVEQKQYKKFTKPVTIYVCNSIQNFTDYCVHSHASGCVLNERLFLSPKNFRANRQALTHELAHLHIEQQLGMFSWHSGYPAWFQEGLATYVSGGEGANLVSAKEARKAIVEGKTFTPNTSGSLIFRKAAHSFGLTPNMFYRQAAMFIGYLHDRDTEKFKTFLLSVEAGKNFKKSFSDAYGNSLQEMWNKFIQHQKSKTEITSTYTASLLTHDLLH